MKKFLLFFLISIISGLSELSFANGNSDTVYAYEATTPPVFDAYDDDDCWKDASWYLIDETWITWGETIDSADFYGRFKVSWSADSNLLYFYVEITDDYYDDGYVFDNGGYPDYDCTELFIDEDNSGGDHQFNENAFAYHMLTDLPVFDTTSQLVAVDISDASYTKENYADHFEHFIMRRFGDKYTREFSLKAYTDNYNESLPEMYRVTLEKDKHIGFSLAYCDDDTPGDGRDNFFGSVYVPQANNNDHWINADFFGDLILKEAMNNDDITENNENIIKIYPNPTTSGINITLPQQIGNTVVSVSDMLGKRVLNKTFNKNNIYLKLENTPPGIYFVQIKTPSKTFVNKILIR